MHSTIEFRAAEMAKFNAAMVKLVAAAEGAGWKLLSALIQTTGRFNTAQDLWIMDDMNHYNVGVAAIRSSPDFPVIAAGLAAIEQETVVFGVRADWLPEGR